MRVRFPEYARQANTRYPLTLKSFMIYNDLIKLKNAYLAGHSEVTLPYSTFAEHVLKVLERKGYVGKVRIEERESRKFLCIELLYTNRTPHLREINFKSKPGARIYLKEKKLKGVRQGYGELIVSTSKGVMTGREAKQAKLGGEVICEVF